MSQDKRILLDCDGVLADFVSGALQAHGRSESAEQIDKWDFFRDWGLSESEFWSRCRGRGFWLGLQAYPWAGQMLEVLRGIGEVTVSTAPSNDPECLQAKLDWLYGNLGVAISEVMVGSRKELMAHPCNILIDDNPGNIRKFNSGGGIGILFPRPWNGASGDWLSCCEVAAEFCGKGV